MNINISKVKANCGKITAEECIQGMCPYSTRKKTGDICCSWENIFGSLPCDWEIPEEVL